jgi:hypothetical protein
MDQDLDPGGSKTCGPGSPTLLKRPGSLFKNPYSEKAVSKRVRLKKCTAING